MATVAVKKVNVFTIIFLTLTRTLSYLSDSGLNLYLILVIKNTLAHFTFGAKLNKVINFAKWFNIFSLFNQVFNWLLLLLLLLWNRITILLYLFILAVSGRYGCQNRVSSLMYHNRFTYFKRKGFTLNKNETKWNDLICYSGFFYCCFESIRWIKYRIF